MPMLLVFVIGLGGYVVIRIRDSFNANTSVDSGDPNISSDRALNPKRVSYEVMGTPGGTASIDYLDENAQPHQIDSVQLPWSFTIVTTLPSMSANVIAQASTTVSAVRCRVIVDGQVRDDRMDAGYQPFIYCLVKSV
ncbi:MmpS family protein [Mycobacterium simiae]|uniref:MmpS family protein n=2 Tax=Mycobacterium simiae TaxID=1784 RepID=A0A1X0YBQ0_MYCSI|nr:MmpS family protein [Mycobacterium simiae]